MVVRVGRAHALTATTLGWAASKVHGDERPASPKKVPFLVAHELVYDAMVRRAQIEALRTTH